MSSQRILLFIRYSYLASALLGLVLIFSPIVWMEIGPNGIAWYGPQVPDIWVYGGSLTGKDLRFTPLLLMMLFQAVWIVIGIVLSLACFFAWKRKRLVGVCASIILLILFLFPNWIQDYVRVIIGNSDGAASDLTVHWTYGLWIFIAIATLNLGAALIALGVRLVRYIQPKLSAA